MIATESGWIKSVESGANTAANSARRELFRAYDATPSPQLQLPEVATKVTQSELIARQSMLKASCMFWQGQHVSTQIICDFADELVKHVLRGV